MVHYMNPCLVLFLGSQKVGVYKVIAIMSPKDDIQDRSCNDGEWGTLSTNLMGLKCNIL